MSRSTSRTSTCLLLPLIVLLASAAEPQRDYPIPTGTLHRSPRERFLLGPAH